MNGFKSKFKCLTWLFMAFLMTAFVAGCGKGDGTGHWNGAPGPVSTPTVIVTVPANAATIVPINRKITATFSEAMVPATINGTTFTVANTTLGGTPVTGTVSYDVASKTAIFTPTTPATLPINTLFTGTITTGAKGVAGNVLASNYVWTFTTGATSDLTAPSVIATGAYGITGTTSGAVNLPINRDSTATFSEPMDPTTITGTTFTVVNSTLGGTPVAGVVSYLNNVATFNPTGTLAANTLFTSTITIGAKDLAGIALAGNAPAGYVWSWTTGATSDTTAPTITLTTPAHLATNVPLNQRINATFSEDMKPATMITANFTVKETVSNNNVPGTVVYDALARIMTFSPQNPLTANTDYTVTVTNGAKDLAGNALVVPAVAGLPKPNPWNFKTGAALVPPPAAVPLASAATYGIMATLATTSTGATHINGDVALNPGSSQGIPPAQVNGVINVDNAAAIQAQIDLLAAYNFCKTLPPGVTVTGGADISGQTLAPGTYTSGSTILINGPLPVTLDGGGNANAVWVFQLGSSLTTVTGGVSLINGAQAKNVFWVPTSDATVGPNTTFNGTILAGRNVTGQTGATINGRILAGAITSGTIALDSNTVNVPAP